MSTKQDNPEMMMNEPGRIYQEGLAAFENEDYVTAIRLLSELMQAHSLPGTMARYYLGQAHLNQGIVELRCGRHAAALEHFQSARGLNPSAAGLARYIAACYAGQGRFDLAVGECEKQRDANESDRDLPIRLAHALACDGQLERGVQTLVDAIYHEPHRVDFRMQLGLFYAASDQYEDAICVLQEAVDLAPGHAELRQHLGLAHAAVEEHDRAIEHLAIAQKLRPNDAYSARLLTLAVDAAKTTCIKLAIRPEVCATEPDDARSIEVLGEIITSDPEFVEAFLSLPPSEVDPQIFTMLAAILEKALELHPDYADLYYHCARVHQRLGLMESAIHQARAAIGINPKYVQALIELGRLYAQTDRSDEAICRLRQAVECGGAFPDVHFLLGELYRGDGRREAACREYRRALQLNGRYEAALEALASVMQG